MSKTINIKGKLFEMKHTNITYHSPITESAERLQGLLVKWANGQATEQEIKECEIRGEALSKYLGI